jgi:hypothetical protein
MFPMFKGEVIYFQIDELPVPHTLTGFDTIFGVGSISGTPLALAKFLLPIVAIMATLIDFFYYKLHIVIYIASGIGIVFTIVYFIAILINLNGSEEIFGFTFYQARTNLSWGCLIMLGTYVLTLALAFFEGRVAEA